MPPWKEQTWPCVPAAVARVRQRSCLSVLFISANYAVCHLLNLNDSSLDNLGTTCKALCPKWKKFGNRNRVSIMPSNSRLGTWKKKNPGSKLVAKQCPGKEWPCTREKACPRRLGWGGLDADSWDRETGGWGGGASLMDQGTVNRLNLK